MFALVSSDSDFTPLAHFLRERGAKVHGFGRSSTPVSFREACTAFTPIKDPVAIKPKSEPKPASSLEELLAGAITKSADKKGWVRLSVVANHMRQQHGQGARDHGKATWTKVLQSLPKYELRNEGTTGVEVRIKPGS